MEVSTPIAGIRRRDGLGATWVVTEAGAGTLVVPTSRGRSKGYDTLTLGAEGVGEAATGALG